MLGKIPANPTHNFETYAKLYSSLSKVLTTGSGIEPFQASPKSIEQ
jgi:hypothetical protein